MQRLGLIRLWIPEASLRPASRPGRTRRVVRQLHHVVERAPPLAASRLQDVHERVMFPGQGFKPPDAVEFPFKRLGIPEIVRLHHLHRPPGAGDGSSQPHRSIASATDPAHEFVVGYMGYLRRGATVRPAVVCRIRDRMLACALHGAPTGVYPPRNSPLSQSCRGGRTLARSIPKLRATERGRPGREAWTHDLSSIQSRFPKSSRKEYGSSRSPSRRVAAGCVPTREGSGWATAAWARVASSKVTPASICHEAGGFPACSRWSRSEATTPPGTHAKVDPGIPAGMPAPRAGLGWHPSRVRRVTGIGDRWCRFAQPPATCCETFGFEQGIPCGRSFGGPRRHFSALGCPVLSERVSGLGPWEPSACHSIRVQGRIREPKSCLRVDWGPSSRLAPGHSWSNPTPAICETRH